MILSISHAKRIHCVGYVIMCGWVIWWIVKQLSSNSIIISGAVAWDKKKWKLFAFLPVCDWHKSGLHPSTVPNIKVNIRVTLYRNNKGCDVSFSVGFVNPYQCRQSLYASVSMEIFRKIELANKSKRRWFSHVNSIVHSCDCQSARYFHFCNPLAWIKKTYFNLKWCKYMLGKPWLC